MKFSESTEVDISLMVKESSFNLEPMIAIIVKLADRIANVEFCIMNENIDMLNIYRKEQEKFKTIIDHEKVNKRAIMMMDYLNHLFLL